MGALARAIDTLELPAVEKISEDSQEDPFEVLIATMLSAQTRDPVTAAASARLFRVARSPRTMAKLCAGPDGGAPHIARRRPEDGEPGADPVVPQHEEYLRGYARASHLEPAWMGADADA
jgi:hypothetical protein